MFSLKLYKILSYSNDNVKCYVTDRKNPVYKKLERV